MCKAVKDEPVDPLRVHPITMRFHQERVFLPLRIDRFAGKGFCSDHFLAKDVADGSDQPHAVIDLLSYPEFAHHAINSRTHLQLFKVARIIRFGIRIDAVFVTKFGKVSIVIVRHEIGLCTAHIPQKTITRIHTTDNPARHRGQVSYEAVAETLLELLWKSGSPVLLAYFVH